MSRSGGVYRTCKSDRWNGFAGDKRVAPNEYELWFGFLEEHDWPFAWVSFELRIPVWAGDAIKLYAGDLAVQETKKKYKVTYRSIDVVGETEDSIFLFELKRRGGSEALGQLLTYKHLYQVRYEPTKPIKLVLVCHSVDMGMSNIFHAHEVKMVVVPDLT